ncbi:MAG: 50S ribosomal protein L21e [Halobacteriaceae archaeon]
MPNSNGPLSNTRNKLKNDPRERGTSPPGQVVADFEIGQSVHLSIDPSVPDGRFHPRFDGLTGEVVGEQGAAYKVAVTDGESEKTLIVSPAHISVQQE